VKRRETYVSAYSQAREVYLVKARSMQEQGMRTWLVGLARDSHHAYLREVGALK
jgi:hypothetical protein